MATLAQWIEGTRPRTLPAAVAPVLAGTAVTVWQGPADWVAAGLAALVSLLLQIGVNFFNDYSDGIRGTDAVRVGPVRLVGQGLVEPRTVRAAAIASLLGASVVGLALVARSQVWILLPVGALAIAAAYGYTGGSRPYGYSGLGELFVFVFFGPVAVLGTTAVTGGDAWWVSGAASIAIGLVTVAILVANNLRDRELDQVAGKHTLAVRLGDDRTRTFYSLCIFVGFAMALAMAAWTTWWFSAALVGLVPAVPAVRAVGSGAQGPALIAVLKQTSFALLGMGFGMFLGAVLSRLG